MTVTKSPIQLERWKVEEGGQTCLWSTDTSVLGLRGGRVAWGGRRKRLLTSHSQERRKRMREKRGKVWREEKMTENERRGRKRERRGGGRREGKERRREGRERREGKERGKGGGR